MQCPEKSGSLHYNYKRYFSVVVLQGIADHSCQFVRIEVGAYGKQSDGGIFRGSHLFKCLEKNNIVGYHKTKTIPGTQFDLTLVIVGDEAYPLLPFLK